MIGCVCSVCSFWTSWEIILYLTMRRQGEVQRFGKVGDLSQVTPTGLDGVLVGSGCLNKTQWISWLKLQKSISHSLRDWEILHSGNWLIQFLMRTLFLDFRWLLASFLYTDMMKREKEIHGGTVRGNSHVSFCNSILSPLWPHLNPQSSKWPIPTYYHFGG